MPKGLTALLRKKNLTGEEVGRLALRDFIQGNKKGIALLGQHSRDEVMTKKQEISLFTEAERQKMIDSIPNTPYEIKMYHSYTALIDFLWDLMKSFSGEKTLLEMTTFKFWTLASTELQGENISYLYNMEKRHRPQIMTQKQYQRELEKQKVAKLKQKRRIDEVIIQTLSHYALLHENGEITPYSELFKKYEKEYVTKPSQLEQYEILEDEEQPNRLDVLSDLNGFYVNHKDGEPIEEFIKDYPDLFKAVTEELSKVTGLKTIKRLKAETMRKREVSVKNLYEAGIPEYIEYLETYYPSQPEGRSDQIAILQGSHYQDDYEEFDLLKPERFFLYDEDEITPEDIVIHMRHLIEGLRQLLAEYETFVIIAERVNEPELMDLVNIDSEIDLIKGLNRTLNRMSKLYPEPRLIKAIKEAEFNPEELVNIENLKPTPESIQQGRELIKDLSYFSKPNKLEYVIKGAIK